MADHLSQNPYASDLDITTPKGRELYRAATKGLKNTKYNLSDKDAEDFFTHVKDTSEKFCWGPVVNYIPVQWNDDGTVKVTKSLFQIKDAITLDEVVIAANFLWAGHEKMMNINSDGLTADITQKRIRSTMIANWIKNSLDDRAIQELSAYSAKYTYIGFGGNEIADGVVMLKVLFDLNPFPREKYPEIGRAHV